MPAGIEVYNDNGNFLIDGNNLNYGLVRKRDFAIDGQITVDIIGPNSIVGFRSSFPVAMQRNFDGSGSIIFNSNTYGIFSVYEFSPGYGGGSNFGLEVYTEGGQLAFSSNFGGFMRFISVAQVDMPQGGVNGNYYPGQATPVNYIGVPSSRPVMVIPSQPRFMWIPDSSAAQHIVVGWLEAFHIEGNTVVRSWVDVFRYSSFYIGSGRNGPVTMPLTFVDVSNL